MLDAFVLKAGSSRERDSWMTALRREVTRCPLMRMLEVKRQRLRADRADATHSHVSR